MLLAEVDRRFFGEETPPPDLATVIEGYLEHVEREMLSGTPLPHMTRHMLGLAHGMAGARSFRRILGEEARQPGAGPETIRRALAAVDVTAAPVAA